MKRTLKLFLACMILAFSIIAAGCGGDPFEGKWYAINYAATGKWCFSGNNFVEIEITKSDDNIYHLYFNDYLYKNYFEHINGNGGRVVKSANFKWGVRNSQHMTAKSGGKNRIIIDGSNEILTYDEKADTILLENIIFKESNDGDLDKFKKDEKARLQKLFDNKQLGFYYRVDNINFADEM